MLWFTPSIYLVAQRVPDFMGWFLHSLNMPQISLEHFFTSDNTRSSSLWDFPCPNPGISPFPKEPWFLLWENGTNRRIHTHLYLCGLSIHMWIKEPCVHTESWFQPSSLSYLKLLSGRNLALIIYSAFLYLLSL